MKDEIRNFADEELAAVSGGVVSPYDPQTEEEALRFAAELGEGKDMGGWKTMSGEEYMVWWRASHHADTEE